MTLKSQLKQVLRKATTCTIQHHGWTCGTCFFAISPKLTNKHWQAVLLTRGDYKRERLNNLPDSINLAIGEVIKLAKELVKERQTWSRSK